MLGCSRAQRNKTKKASYIFVSAGLRMSDVRVYDSTTRGTNSQGLESFAFFCKKLYKAQDKLHLLIFVWNRSYSTQNVGSHATFMKRAYQPILFLFLFYVSKSDSFGNNSLVRSAHCPAPVFQSKETRFSPGEAVKAEVTMCL